MSRIHAIVRRNKQENEESQLSQIIIPSIAKENISINEISRLTKIF